MIAIRQKILATNIWSQFKISDQQNLWDIGTVKIWYKQIAKEIWISYKHEKGTDNKEDSSLLETDDLSWSRWVVKETTDHIKFVPIFPDRPVVVKPEHSFTLKKNAQAKIYVRVPIWIRIEINKSKPIKVLDIPSVVLSNTWFGDFRQGELCYWISTSAQQQIKEDLVRPFLAICPIKLINNSDDNLPVEKICLRVEGLSIYNNIGQLWGDETKVIYKGKDEISQVEVLNTAPEEAKSAILVSAPSKRFKRGLRMLTFDTIKEISGLGFLVN